MRAAVGPAGSHTATPVPADNRNRAPRHWAIPMEGYMTVLCGGHLLGYCGEGGAPARGQVLWFSLECAGELRCWGEQTKGGKGGRLLARQISDIRICDVRKSQAGTKAVQFSATPLQGRPRLVRLLPLAPDRAENWIPELRAALQQQHPLQASRATPSEIAAPNDGSAIVGTKQGVIKEGKLLAQYSGLHKGAATWIPLYMRLHQRTGTGCILQYESAEAVEAVGSPSISAGDVDTKLVSRVQFGFDRQGASGSQPDKVLAGPSPLSRPRASCQFQFCIANAAKGSPACTSQVMRLQAQTTRECIDWVHTLRRVCADCFEHPELLPAGSQRLVRAVFKRAVKNIDGKARATDLVRQLQSDKALCAIFPQEHGPNGDGDLERAAAWLFGTFGEDPPESISCSAFLDRMNRYQRVQIEEAASRFKVLTASEAVEQLRQQWDLPQGMSAAEVIWIVEERIGLPHDHDHGDIDHVHIEEMLVLLFAQRNIHVIIVDDEAIDKPSVRSRVGPKLELVDYTKLDDGSDSRQNSVVRSSRDVMNLSLHKSIAVPALRHTLSASRQQHSDTMTESEEIRRALTSQRPKSGSTSEQRKDERKREFAALISSIGVDADACDQGDKDKVDRGGQVSVNELTPLAAIAAARSKIASANSSSQITAATQKSSMPTTTAGSPMSKEGYAAPPVGLTAEDKRIPTAHQALSPVIKPQTSAMDAITAHLQSLGLSIDADKQ